MNNNTENNININYAKDENNILINKDNESLNSSIIDIESNCCNFNNHQRNTRRIIINVSLFLMNIISLAGIITLLIKK